MAKKKVSVRGAARREKAEQKRLLAAERPIMTKDSFQNFITQTGIGTNNQSSFNTYGFNPLTQDRNILEWMYRGSWICSKAIDCIADDMTRAGIELGSDITPDEGDKMHRLITSTGVWAALNLTLKWARLYGGACAAILIDGQDPRTPLRPETVQQGGFKGLQVFDRWMVDPTLEDLITDLGPDLGKPKYYKVVATAPALVNQSIHHSRMIRIEGVDLPFWQKLTVNLWGGSVLEPLYDRLTAFDSVTQGGAQLAYRAHLRTLKIAGLRRIVASGGDAFRGLLRQVDAMRMFQNNEGVTLVDGEDEFETHSYSFAGLSDLLIQFGQQISGATGIPLVRLFGQSPAGLNSTGESDLRNYYDVVNQEQENKLRNGVMRLLRVIAMSEGVALPDNFNYSFRPLWQLTASEKADVAEKKTRTTLAARDSGLVGDQTALRELKGQSNETGVWSNITDEQIQQADEMPPSPDELLGAENPDAALNPLPEGAEPKALPAPTGDAVPLVNYLGLPVKIETRKGAVRRSRNPENPWEVVMPAHYGEILRTEGADGDCVDCFLGPVKDSRHVWVINQIDIQSRKFDEHKVMLGYDNQAQALADYLSAFSDGRAHERIGAVAYMSLNDFMGWLRTRGTTQQMSMAAE